MGCNTVRFFERITRVEKRFINWYTDRGADHEATVQRSKGAGSISLPHKYNAGFC